MSILCDECGKEFSTKQGYGIHHTKTHKTRKWNDEQWLREEYITKRKSAKQIANEVGVDIATITSNLEKNSIEQRDLGVEIQRGLRNKAVRFYTRKQDGYEFWKLMQDYERYRLQHHRLLAVAEFGIDAVKGKVVHHKNEIPWDNRPENIELLSRGEHARHHYPDLVNQSEYFKPIGSGTD